MMRMMWRQLAFGALAATLAVGIAACDDDTTSSTDMAVGADMSASVDMSTGMTPGNGQITLADVVGTVYSPSLPNGMAPRTHTLVAVASLPKFAGTPDPSSDFGLTPTPHGCSIYRYSQTNPPTGDGDAGDVTMSGYNTLTLATNTSTGSTQQTPTPITCKRVGPLMAYTCFYAGMMGPDAGADGTPTGDVIFPLVPYGACVDPSNLATCVQGPGSWPFGATTCDPHVVGAPGSGPGGTTPVACEQHPLSSFSEVMEATAGGADWPMKMATLGNGGGPDGGVGMFPGAPSIVSVTNGGSDIAGPDPFDANAKTLDLKAAIDTSKDLAITWSCDGSATPGAGCTGTTDLVGLLLQTSTSTRDNFSNTTAQGAGQCANLVSVSGATITVKAAQLAALFGGQMGGSIELALVRLRFSPQILAGGRVLAFTGGMGVFGFTNQ